MDANEYDCIQYEILLLILVPHTHPFILEFCHIFHEWFQEHINIDVNFLWTLNKNRQHKVLSFVTQQCWKIVQHEDEWPCAVHGPIFTKCIHSISKQTLYFYSLIQMVYIEDKKISTEFYLQGVESPHYFFYASQNASVPVSYP
jgi:hypothetical protein